MIRFSKVSKSFGSKCVLDELSFEIKPGKVTFVIGKSGEGKSVTIKHIMGLLKPDHGSIEVDQHEITGFSKQELVAHRRKFGMLFQHAALFDSMSVKDNILFPLKENTAMSDTDMMSRVAEVLSQVGLKGVEDQMPSALSTGEKKRVGLARALAAKPQFILYDEPTTGMDPLVSEMIDNLIVKISAEEKELTSIVISHDLKAALATADEIIMLYKGSAVLVGSPEDFRSSSSPVVRQFFAGRTEGPIEFY